MGECTLKDRVSELHSKHGGFRMAGRAIRLDAAYLLRLGNGESINPSAATLRRLGLKRIVTYKRIQEPGA